MYNLNKDQVIQENVVFVYKTIHTKNLTYMYKSKYFNVDANWDKINCHQSCLFVCILKGTC